MSGTTTKASGDLVVILTALDLEYSSVRSKMIKVEARHHPAGTRFEVGYLGDRGCMVALGLTGTGNHPAAVLAERAIAEFSPVAVIFVGVAGALWPDQSLGELVVATRVYAYHGGTSEDDGLKARPRSWEIAHGPEQIARHIARTGEWRRHLPTGSQLPKVRFGPIVAGEVVKDSTRSAHAQWIREHYNDAIAIEMESAGVAQAGHLNNSLPVIVVRAISDMGDGRKVHADGAGWQPRAVANAAAFAAALAEELDHEQRDTARSVKQSGADLRGDVQQAPNISISGTHVGVQAGQVFGGIHYAASPGSPSDPPEVQLSDLREQLLAAYRQGQIDKATCEAAEAELDTAAEALTANPGESGKVIVALKRLRGLLADVADLAAKVAAVMSAVRGL